MDLGAYVQINELEDIAKANDISIPRLRGYRLMKDEEPIDMKEWIDVKDIALTCVKNLCRAEKFWNPYDCCHILNSYTDYVCGIFIKNYKKPNAEVNWSVIHGWKRKVLKKMIHDKKKTYIKQAEVFNKYVGREGVLYIHARIGGNNWKRYCQDVQNEEWFLEKVDDAFDNTYCDIYAKLNRLENVE